MINVHLEKVFVEFQGSDAPPSEFGKANTRWYATVALDLFDEHRQMKVAEWFYLIACSPQYLQDPLKRGPRDIGEKYLVVQDSFNLEEVEDIAEQKMATIKPKNWDEFYAQME